MRVTSRLRGESGATAVIVAIMLLVLVGMLALAVDGGLLWTKFRRLRSANDAAALAAAYSCAKGEGLAGADAKAGEVALANVTDASPTQPSEYPMGCEVNGGEVTTHFGGEQVLLFGPAVGVSSPKPVAAAATAIWGGAGGASNVVPLMLAMNRLSTCGIPFKVAPGDPCFFWWDNGTRNDQSELTNAEWGLVDLNTWDTPPEDSCPGNASQGEVSDWIYDGFPGTLMIVPAGGPVYVCRGAGFQGGALNNDITAQRGELLFFPVNDPYQQVQAGGSLCGPDLLNGPCTVYRYAIVGFAVLEVVNVWTGQDAQTMCNHTAGNNGSLRCLEAVWRDFQPGGVMGLGGGQNFGLFAVALTG